VAFGFSPLSTSSSAGLFPSAVSAASFNEIGCPDQCFFKRIHGAEQKPVPVLLPNKIKLLFG
jgi:hypothetical protein